MSQRRVMTCGEFVGTPDTERYDSVLFGVRQK